MYELPEALSMSRRFNEMMTGKTITDAIANSSPHKFAWYHGNPEDYSEILVGKTITGARPAGGMLDVLLGDYHLVFSDGASLRLWEKDDKKIPKKHQLYLKFDDGSILTCSIQMYGGMLAFKEGGTDNGYYLGSLERISPFSDEFDFEFFKSLYNKDKDFKLTVKALLATNQRIPGFGNGVLQDILWLSNLHPKRVMDTVSDEEYFNLFNVIKSTLKKMAELGGRDTEKDLHGNNCGYKTVMSRMNKNGFCPACGAIIIKEAYLGGSVYWCPNCQKR